LNFPAYASFHCHTREGGYPVFRGATDNN
jgi:hypothetical protein